MLNSFVKVVTFASEVHIIYKYDNFCILTVIMLLRSLTNNDPHFYGVL